MKKNYAALLLVTLASSTSLFACSGDDAETPAGTGGAVAATGGADGTGGATGGATTTGGATATGGMDAGTGGAATGGDGTGGDGTGGEDATSADFSVVMIDGLGDVITNEAGFTLYTFATDTKGGEGTGVNMTWPAVKVAAPPNVGAGLDAADFGVTPLGQSTYDGWPLYTYAQDTAPGEAKGNSGAWPVAKPLP